MCLATVLLLACSACAAPVQPSSWPIADAVQRDLGAAADGHVADLQDAAAVDGPADVTTDLSEDATADATSVCAPATALAAAPAQSCGSHDPPPSWLVASADGWTANCGQFQLQVRVLGAGAIRLRYVPDGGPQPWPSRAVLEQPALPAGAVAVGGTCTGAALCTPALALHIDAQCRVRAVDVQGHELLTDPPEGAFSLVAGQPRLTRLAPAGLRFYGLGAKTGGLDRRGRVLTLRTTDAYNASLGGYDPSGDPLYQAVPWLLFKNGATTWGVLSDNPWMQTYDLAASSADRWRVTAAGGVLDQILVAGPTPGQVLDTYTQLTGRPFLPPRWALGYHQSRWGYKDAATFANLAKTFRDLKIPCDSLWFDIQKMQGFRSFTWDPATFPDPKTLLTGLHAQGFHAVSIVDPGLKADPAWPAFADGLSAGHFLPAGAAAPYLGNVWPGLAAFPDFSNPAVRQWWASQLVPLETNLGTDALWIDMNEPSDFTANQGGSVPDSLAVQGDGKAQTMAAAHNLYALRMAEATQAGLQAAYPDRRPFVLTRAGYAGIGRHAAAWTGDAPSTVATLAGTLPMLLGLGLSGQPLVGSDVGGYSGSSDPALFGRWFALGSVSPFFRGHAEQNAPNQEPWQFGQEVQDIARELANARYRLLPYLESLADEAHQSGTPMLRPLWWHFADDPALDNLGDEALLGPFVLVAPYLAPPAQTRTVLLPAGRWVQASSGAVVQGPSTITVSGPLADLPMWLRQGAILPRGPLRQWATQAVAGPLDLDVVPGPQPSHFDLRQDDGDGPPDAPYRRTRLTLTPTPQGTELSATILAGADFGVPSQAWRVRVWRLDSAPGAVRLGGQTLTMLADAKLQGSSLGWTWDANERALLVALPAGAIAKGEWTLQIDHAQGPDGPPLLEATTVQVLLTVQVPPQTPPGATIYVAHSANGWQQQALTWSSLTGEAFGMVTVPRGAWFEYKYTRGAWSSVEKYPGCIEAKNRYAFGAVHSASLDVAGKQDTVWAWADACP